MTTKKSNAKKTGGKKAAKPRTIKVVEETGDGRTVETASTPATVAKGKRSKADDGDKKLSALDAAARVLAEAGEPLNTKQMVEAMAAKGYARLHDGRQYGWVTNAIPQDAVKSEFRRLAAKYDAQA